MPGRVSIPPNRSQPTRASKTPASINDVLLHYLSFAEKRYILETHEEIPFLLYAQRRFYRVLDRGNRPRNDKMTNEMNFEKCCFSRVCADSKEMAHLSESVQMTCFNLHIMMLS